MTSTIHPPSSPEGDEAAVAVVRRLADLAAGRRGFALHSILTPTTGWSAWRMRCAWRARPIARTWGDLQPCHWLKVDGENLRERIVEARPHLFMVTINGADAGGDNWKAPIQPLGDGAYDVRPLLALLEELNSRGPHRPPGLRHRRRRGRESAPFHGGLAQPDERGVRRGSG